ncbi:MAG: hypothetical protein AAFN93_26975 [Bacteroidota bacterium]
MQEDTKLYELISKIQSLGNSNIPERRRLTHLLLIKITHLPRLYRSSHQDYPEALNRTLLWVSKKIDTFEVQENKTVSESLISWINTYLKYRVWDLVGPEEPGLLRLDKTIETDGQNLTTWKEKMVEVSFGIPSVSGLDGYIKSLKDQENQDLGLKIEEYIEQDPEGRLRACHPKKHKQCNCQALSQRVLLDAPPARFSKLSEEFGINYQTLKSHWEKKCRPLLKKIAIELGYTV